MKIYISASAMSGASAVKYLLQKFFIDGGKNYYKRGAWSIASGGYDLVAEIRCDNAYGDPTQIIDILYDPYGYKVESGTSESNKTADLVINWLKSNGFDVID